ncbi:MAG TPA: DNA-processing protein DprA [Candidatus Melainabacteria bacterium]|nr:DNA-processing protein DprA [Candidatus Melainabacteria bacterium]
MGCGQIPDDGIFQEITSRDERELRQKLAKDLPYWLGFDQLSGVGLGGKRLRMLFDHFLSAEAAWSAKATEMKALPWLKQEQIEQIIQKRKEINLDQLLETLEKVEVTALPFNHPLYPSRLREIADPPIVLYMKGQLTPQELDHSIAIVGTRRPTTYGQRLAKEFARGLAEAGATIVSGMAIGVDSLCHWGAIEGGGRTVAVLANGPDLCYPTSNRPLYNGLIDGTHGAVISEFFPGTKPESWRFPARNRIISGLSKGVVVIEAGATSGSLITADIGFEQSREIFAIPGRIDAPMSMGCNKLIAANKAQLVMNHIDVLNALNWVSVPTARDVPTMVELFGREKEVFELVTSEPIHFDVLSQKLEMSAGELSATLTMLELAGIVERLPGDWYSRLSKVSTL